MTLLYTYSHTAHAAGSLFDWVLHLVVASAIWRLIGRLVSEQPMVAILVVLTALAMLYAQRRARRAGS